MRKLFTLLIVALGLALAGPAAAQDVGAAKAQGFIGEQADGYLGVVSGGAPPAVRRMVDEINLRRREVYRQAAAETGATLVQVEARAGQRLIGQARPGEYIRDPSGQWRRAP